MWTAGRRGTGVTKAKVDRVWRVILSEIDPGRLVTVKRCQNCLKVGRLKFRNHCKATRGLIRYDTIHAVVLQRQTRRECAFGHAGGRQRGAWFRWRAGPNWRELDNQATLQPRVAGLAHGLPLPSRVVYLKEGLCDELQYPR